MITSATGEILNVLLHHRRSWELNMHRGCDTNRINANGSGGVEGQAAKNFDHYDGTFSRYLALAPAIWLSITGLLLLVALSSVGYLTEPETDIRVTDVSEAINAHKDLTLQRAAKAYSGVTFGITMALSVAIFFWAGVAFHGKSPKYRRQTLTGVTILIAVLIFAYLLLYLFLDGQPFTSKLGNVLIYPERSGKWTIGVPDLMFAIACAVPAILTAGACLLLQPMRVPIDGVVAKAQLKLLVVRLKQLDQMLYIGALALVFGTLQLAAAMSVSLASMPKLNDVKVQADLCKTLTSTSPLPFFAPGASGSTVNNPVVHERCLELPQEFFHLELAESLRQLSRGVTMSFGLAFSSLLVAIYVPALIGLRLMIEPRQRAMSESTAATEEAVSAIGEFDPMRRIAAAAATLSPLIAGLLANTFASG